MRTQSFERPPRRPQGVSMPSDYVTPAETGPISPILPADEIELLRVLPDRIHNAKASVVDCENRLRTGQAALRSLRARRYVAASQSGCTHDLAKAVSQGDPEVFEMANEVERQRMALETENSRYAYFRDRFHAALTIVKALRRK